MLHFNQNNYNCIKNFNFGLNFLVGGYDAKIDSICYSLLFEKNVTSAFYAERFYENLYNDLDNNKHDIIIVEGIFNDIHPKLQEEYAKLYDEKARKKGIIIVASTYSPIAIKSVSPDNVYYVEGESIVGKLKDVTNDNLIKPFGVGKNDKYEVVKRQIMDIIVNDLHITNKEITLLTNFEAIGIGTKKLITLLKLVFDKFSIAEKPKKCYKAFFSIGNIIDFIFNKLYIRERVKKETIDNDPRDVYLEEIIKLYNKPCYTSQDFSRRGVKYMI